MRRMETPMTEWEIHGMEFGNCNCDYGCPCQFNALPTHRFCQAIGFFSIDKGHFGECETRWAQHGLRCRLAGRCA